MTVFTLHLMGAIENAGPYVEYSIEGPDYYPLGTRSAPPGSGRPRDGKVQIRGALGASRSTKDWLAKGELSEERSQRGLTDRL